MKCLYFVSCLTWQLEVRNWRYTGKATWQNLIFEELFTPTLNWRAISVQYVSSMPVVLHAGLKDQLRRTQINKVTRNKKTEDSDAFARDNKSFIYMFQWSLQVNRKIHLCHRNEPIYMSSRRKARKTQQVAGYKHKRKTSGLFTKRTLTLVSAIMVTQVPLQKFLFL